MREFEELRIRVRRIGPQRYLALAAGAAAGATVLRIDDEPTRLRKEFERLINIELHQAPTGGTRPARAIQRLGRQVYQLLFDRELSSCLDAARARQGAGGLRLRFDLPPELQELPVEAFRPPADRSGHLPALDANLSLARTLAGDPLGHRLPGPDDDPERIRVLVAVSSPDRLPSIDASPEIAAIERLPSLAADVDVMAHATRDRILNWLGRRTGPAAFLLIAHGEYDRRDQEGYVLLEDGDGGVDRVPSHLLSGMLVKAPKLRLVLLNLCHGAQNSPSEPFSGLAQALVRSGVPAVVGMNGPITDESAFRIGPLLLEHICANATVDEAVTDARQQIAHKPETDIEWATPALYLHEACGHGWLFKARQVSGGAAETPDPLRAGADSLRQYKESSYLSAEVVLQAARFLRQSRDWDEVRRTVENLPHGEIRKSLAGEAALELAWPAVEDLCRILADQDGPARAEAALRNLEGRLPDRLWRLLGEEVGRFTGLDALMAEATDAERDQHWKEAASGYARVLESSETGFRDAAARLQAAREEAELDDRYQRAIGHRQAGHWDQAADEYRRILEARPEGYRDTTACADYVDGRSLEEANDWGAAAESHERCGDYRDAPARRHYALGRAAADRGDWAEAQRCFAEADGAEKDATQWLGYAAARAAEAESDWEHAVEHLTGLDGFTDSEARLLLARGHLALAAGRPLKAVECFTKVPELDPPLEGALQGLYEAAAAAQTAGRWAEANERFQSLPDDYRDSAGRRSYCAARESEDRGDWSAAAGGYAAASGHGDAAARLAYARARLAESDGDWHAARDHFASAPHRLLDLDERLRYAAGRAAAHENDWNGVISGFGELPDDFEHGEVGRHRRFARASLAVLEEDWESVLAELRESRDDELDGRVGLLRIRARGSRAESDDHWDEAAAVYRLGAETDEVIARRYRYALLRCFEAEEDWNGVIEASGGLPSAYRDVEHRRRHAAACLAARQEHWHQVIELCGDLPEAFADTAKLFDYARARLALLEHRLDDALELAAGLDGYCDAETLARYSRGRLAERREDWDEALKSFESTDHDDAEARANRCRARQLEESGQWSAAIEAYEAAAGALPEVTDRCERLRRLRAALPWAEGLANAALVADPIALEQETFPYLALAEAGISPASTTEEVNDAAFMLMGRGSMAWQARVAWDRLRSPAQRLVLDAQLYWLRDPRALGRALAAIDLDSGADPLAQLCERLPDDAPLFTLLAGGRAEAIEGWLRRLAGHPDDTAVAHCLALASYWQAQRLEDTGAWEQAARSWRTALVCAAALINDDNYWVSWRQARAACYDHAVTPADSARMRANLGNHLIEVLSAYAERHASAGRPRPAAANRALVELFESEMEAARCLGDVGGLPLDDEETVIACGPGYLEITGLRLHFARFIARLESASGSGDGPGEAALRRLRWAFSELTQAFTRFEHHRFESVFESLPDFHLRPRGEQPEDCGGPDSPGHDDGDACEHCRDFLAADPAYALLPMRRDRLLRDAVELSVRTRLSIGQSLLASDERRDDALDTLAEAIAVSANATMVVRTRQAVLWMILGRVESLADRGTRQLHRITAAIELLERAAPVVGSFGRPQIDRRLADLLVTRGVVRRTVDPAADIELSLEDMRRANRLHPGSIRTVENLSRALLTALDRIPAGREQDHMRVLLESLELLGAGLVRFPHSAPLDSADKETLAEIKKRNLNDLSFERLATLLDSYEDDPPEELHAAALRHRAEGDATLAIDYLVRAVGIEPANEEYRRALIETIREKYGLGGDTA